LAKEYRQKNIGQRISAKEYWQKNIGADAHNIIRAVFYALFYPVAIWLLSRIRVSDGDIGKIGMTALFRAAI